MILELITCAPPIEGIADMLDRVSEIAGEEGISSMAIAIIDRNGESHTLWSESSTAQSLIGAVAVLQARLVSQLID